MVDGNTIDKDAIEISKGLPTEELDRLDEKYGKWVAYDIETDPIGLGYQSSRSNSEKVKHAPKPRVMVIFVSWTRGMYSFWPDELEAGLEILKGADVIVSFNGRSFDERVLVAHTSLSRRFSKKKSLDLAAELQSRRGVKTSLDTLVRENFGERKMVSGRKMADLDREKLEIACASDVRHTILVLEKFTFDFAKLKSKHGFDYEAYAATFGGPHSSISRSLERCRECNSTDGYYEDSEYDDDMTDGQYATYQAGYWGIWICLTCGAHSFNEA